MNNNSSRKRLYRSRTNRKVAGVCGGLGDYFNVDPTIMRLIYIMVILFSVGLGILAYIVMWVVMPEEPAHQNRTVDQQGSGNTGSDHKE